MLRHEFYTVICPTVQQTNSEERETEQVKNLRHRKKITNNIHKIQPTDFSSKFTFL